MIPFKTKHAGLTSRFTCSYVSPTIHLAGKSASLSASDLPVLRRSFTSTRAPPLSPHSLWFSLFRAIGGPLYLTLILQSAGLAFFQLVPACTRRFLEFLEGSRADGEGVRLACVLFLVSALSYLNQNLVAQSEHQTVCKASSILTANIANKTARLSAGYIDRQGPAYAMHIMGKADSIAWFLYQLNHLWPVPFNLGLALYLLWGEVGGVLFASLALSFLSLVVSGAVSARAEAYEPVKDGYGKQLMQRVSEYAKGIKTIKLNGWDEFAESRVRAASSGVSDCEIRSSVWSQLNSGQQNLFGCLAVATAIYYFALTEGALTAAKIYTVVTLYQQLRDPLSSLGRTLAELRAMNCHVQKLSEFLLAPESAPHSTPGRKISKGEVLIENVTFHSRNGGPAKAKRTVLKYINLHVNPGELMGITGKVGSGKSLLCRAMLNELDFEAGTAETGGKVAYLPQDPWIFGATLRDNVVMDQKFDSEKYARVVRACALDAEVELSDSSVVGSRGNNLSGGQRQRVALARAVYSEADIYIFDDSLSQLDPQMAESVFKGVVEGYLLGKTRIFVTSNERWLRKMKRVVALHNGEIMSDGSAVPMLWLGDVRNRANSKNAESAAADSSSPSMSPVRVRAEEKSAPLSIWAMLRKIVAYGPNWLLPILPVLIFAISYTEELSTSQLYTWSSASLRASVLSYSAAILGAFLLPILYVYLRTRYESEATLGLHSELFRRFVNAPLSWHNGAGLGQVVSRLTTNFGGAFKLFNYTLNIAQQFARLFSSLSRILVFLPEYLLSVAASFIFFSHLSTLYNPLVKSTIQLEESSREQLLSRFQEFIDGLLVVRASNSVLWLQNRAMEQQDAKIRAILTHMMGLQWMDFRWKSLATIVLAVVVAFCLARAEDVAPGAAAVILQYNGNLSWNIQYIGMLIAEYSATVATCRNFVRFFGGIPSESQSGDKPVLSGQITVRNLSIRYSNDSPLVLSGADLNIAAGEKLGLVGRSGCGKSTFLQCLVRLVESSHGEVMLGSKDISGVALEELRKQVMLVPQEAWLAAGSVRENLDPYRRRRDEEIARVLEEVGLKGLLERRTLDGGSILDVKVTEGGGNLSQGEKQLMSLARVIIRRPAVVLLDESMSSLDESAEAHITSLISRELAASTVVTVAHRPGSLQCCSRVVEIKDGRFVDASVGAVAAE